jgi:hypothetical protein
MNFIGAIIMTTDANHSLDLASIRISALTESVDLSRFNCGVQDLDSFLRKKCQKAHRQNRIKAFYAHLDNGETALGIYTLGHGPSTFSVEVHNIRGHEQCQRISLTLTKIFCGGI